MNTGEVKYKNTPGAILVDVRESDEFASGHIPGAVNERKDKGEAIGMAAASHRG